CGIVYAHIFPYSARPGTPAARMPQLPRALVRERAQRLRGEAQRQKAGFFAAQIGRVKQGLAETPDLLRTDDYAPVRLAAPVEAGRVLRARITGVGADHML